MGVHWAAGLTRWMPVTIGPETYPLNHLHPFRFEVVMPADRGLLARTVMVHVGFGLHTFSRESVATDALEERVSDEHESRTFDEERFRLSHELPALIRALETRPCAFAKHDNFESINVIDDAGVNVRYGVVSCRSAAWPLSKDQPDRAATVTARRASGARAHYNPRQSRRPCAPCAIGVPRIV
jgi:hypothetical protein